MGREREGEREKNASFDENPFMDLMDFSSFFWGSVRCVETRRTSRPGSADCSAQRFCLHQTQGDIFSLQNTDQVNRDLGVGRGRGGGQKKRLPD